MDGGILQAILTSLSQHASSVIHDLPTAVANSNERQVFLNWARVLARATEHTFICHFMMEEGQISPKCCGDFLKLILARSSEPVGAVFSEIFSTTKMQLSRTFF